MKELSSTMVVPHVLPRSLSFNPRNVRAAFHVPTWLESLSLRWLYRSRFCFKKDSNEDYTQQILRLELLLLLLSSQRWLFPFRARTAGRRDVGLPAWKKLPRKLGSETLVLSEEPKKPCLDASGDYVYFKTPVGLGYTGDYIIQFYMGTVTSYCKES